MPHCFIVTAPMARLHNILIVSAAAYTRRQSHGQERNPSRATTSARLYSPSMPTCNHIIANTSGTQSYWVGIHARCWLWYGAFLIVARGSTVTRACSWRASAGTGPSLTRCAAWLEGGLCLCSTSPLEFSENAIL